MVGIVDRVLGFFGYGSGGGQKRGRDEPAAEAEVSPKKPKPASAPAGGFTARGVADSASGGKFWECTVEGRMLTTRWGKLGSAGRSQSKQLADEAAAILEAEKLVATKARGGYTMDDGFWIEPADQKKSGAGQKKSGGPRLYLADPSVYDGSYNGEEWDEGLLEADGQPIAGFGSFAGDPEAIRIAKALGSDLRGISINNGAENDFQWEPLIVASPGKPGKSGARAALKAALGMQPSAKPTVSDCGWIKRSELFWRRTRNESPGELEELDEGRLGDADRCKQATNLMADSLSQHVHMKFGDYDVVVGPIFYGGYTEAGSLVGVMGTRVYT